MRVGSTISQNTPSPTADKNYEDNCDGSTSSWRPIKPLDFVLCTLRALRPCDPRNDDMTVANIKMTGGTPEVRSDKSLTLGKGAKKK